MSIFDPVGLVSRSPKAGLPVYLIFGVIPIKPNDFTVALKGKDVGGDPVKEPAVMTDH